MWILRCYDQGQDGGFRGWYDSQDAEIQTEIEVALELLAGQPVWADDLYYEPLRGACSGLGEIKIDLRMKADARKELQVCYRILGYKTDGTREFTMLCGFQKISGSEYSTYCPMARSRKEKVLKDGNRASLWPL